MPGGPGALQAATHCNATLAERIAIEAAGGGAGHTLFTNVTAACGAVQLSRAALPPNELAHPHPRVFARVLVDAVAGLWSMPPVSPNGQLLSRRGRSVPAIASGLDTHRGSISSRFDCSRAGRWPPPSSWPSTPP
jgi:hypothetical protein